MSSPPYGHRSHEGSAHISDSDSETEPKLPLNQFYPYIRCALCCGFLIDATTIIECLHTFCKSCIVKHFFYSSRCPTCNIVVHQSQPLYNIRPDRQLQDIVYKMIPYLEEYEREQMCNFYKERGMEVPKPVVITSPAPVGVKRQRRDNTPQSVFTIPPELDVSLLLDFVGAEEGIIGFKPLERRYVRVSGEATIRHVELFIRRKMELSPTCLVSLPGLQLIGQHSDMTTVLILIRALDQLGSRTAEGSWHRTLMKVDVVCGDHLLDPSQSLKDVQSTVGDAALQDGLLVLQFGLILPAHS